MKIVHCPSDPDVNWRPPMQGNSHTVQVKEPHAISKWLLVGLHPATRVYNVHSQSTPRRLRRK